MNTLDLIRHKGIEIAQKYNLFKLPILKEIPSSDEIVANFIKIEMEDLFSFQTIFQIQNSQNLFARAYLYNFEKGAEFALSHMQNSPLHRIGYNFEECIKGSISNLIPFKFKDYLNEYSPIMLEMYMNMYDQKKGRLEQLILEGEDLDKPIFVILNSSFYWGTRVMLAQEITQDLVIDYSSNNEDITCDFDDTTKNYEDKDFQIPMI